MNKTVTIEKTELGKVIKNFDSKRIPLSTMERSKRKGVYPYYGAAEIIDYVDDYLFDGLYLLIAEDGTVTVDGNKPMLQLVNGKFWANNHTHIIQGENEIETKYLYYALLGTNIRPYITGAVQLKLNQQNLNRIELPYPLKKEYRSKLVEIFTAYDNKIKLNNKTNQTLEQMAQAIFKEWFIDFRFPGYEKAEFVDSDLGRIPKRWEVKMLPNVFDFLEGPGIRNWQYTTEGCPFINIRLIQNNDIDIKSANCVSEEEANGTYDHFHLMERDMVVSTSGTLGRSAIVRKEHLPLLLNTSVIRFRPKGDIGYSFMYQFLNSRYFQHKVTSMASGSAQPNFGPIHLRQIEVLVPDDFVIRKFKMTVDSMYDQIINNISESQHLASLRDLLLPKLMRGEIKL
jgi:type I restriction enzyme S subunit